MSDTMKRRDFVRMALVGGGLASCGLGSGRSPAPTSAAGAGGHEPIIDVHMHAYPADAALAPSLTNPITGKANTLTTGEAHLQACLAEMKRLNIVKGVVSGGDGDRIGAALHWRDAAPDRIIAGAGVRGTTEIPLPDLAVLRREFQAGRIRVLGEITAQYAGLTLSDPPYEPYLALAEEFDVSISLHTGIGPPGTSYDPCCRGFRASLGNPASIEEALNRHPKLRVNLMHAGYPYIAETIALMIVYPQVSVDLGALGWGLPRSEFYAYLGELVRAGMGKRVMFGSDHMYWPDLIGRAVEAIDAAPFLSPAERRDIYFHNAVRFLKLT